MEFSIATADGVKSVDGWIDRFVGIYSISPDHWSVTHIPSGHKIGEVTASLGTAKLIAREIASLTDWGAFTALDGWKRADPDLPRKIIAFADECEEFVTASGGHRSQEVADAVAARNVSAA